MRTRTLIAIAGLAMTTPALAEPAKGPIPTTQPTVARTTLSSAGARRVIDAAVQLADANGWGSSIAVVDNAGRLLAFHRTDGAPIGTIDVAQGKAFTALKFRMPTQAVQDMVGKGGPAMLTLGEMVAVVGGYPIVRNGEVIGAIGVSGGMAGEDEIVAHAGLSALDK
jgi:glc operon protein GlcG